MSSSSPELAGATGLAGVPAQLAILVVDDQRRCLEANLSACRLLGLPRRAAIGRTVDDFLASGMRKRLDHVWRAFREGGGHAGPFELSSQAAEVHEVNISVVANVLPGRHLLILSATESTPGEVEAARSLRPVREAAPPRSAAGRASAGAGRPRASARCSPCWPQEPPTSRSRRCSTSPRRRVQTHVRNAKAKLGARTRAQAVAMALQHGMISLS